MNPVTNPYAFARSAQKDTGILDDGGLDQLVIEARRHVLHGVPDATPERLVLRERVVHASGSLQVGHVVTIRSP